MKKPSDNLFAKQSGKSIDLIKISEAARILGVSIDTARRWEKSGKITSIRTPGGTRLFSTNDLLALNLNKNIPSEEKITISEASQKLGVSAKTLRRWDLEDKLPAQRSETGERLFNLSDVRKLISQPTPITQTKFIFKEIPLEPAPATTTKTISLHPLITKSILTTTLLTVLTTAIITVGYLKFPNQTKNFFAAAPKLQAQADSRAGQVLGIQDDALGLLQTIGAKILSPFNFLSQKAIEVTAPQIVTQQQISDLTNTTEKLSHDLDQVIADLSNIKISLPVSLPGKSTQTYINYKSDTSSLNLLPNSSFEANNSGLPNRWIYVGNSTSANTFITNEISRSGYNSLKFVGGTKYLGILSPDTVTGESRPYHLSFYLKAYQTDSLDFKLQISFWDPVNKKRVGTVTKDIYDSNLTDLSSGWQLVEFDMNSPGPGQGKNWFPVIEFPDLDRGVVYLDDVSVTEVGQSGWAMVRPNGAIDAIGDGSVFVTADGEIFPYLSGHGSLGTSTNRFQSLYLSNASIDKDGNANFNGKLTATGTTTISGTINLTGGIGTNLVPLADNTYNLGQSDYRWKTGYFGTSLIVGSSTTLTPTNLTFEGVGTIASASTTNLTINSGTTGTLSLDSGSTGTVNLGNGNSAKTVNIASGTGGNTINLAGTGATGADTINIGTGGTAADTITIGSSTSATTIAGTVTQTGRPTFTQVPTLAHTGTWATGSSTWNQSDATIYINPASAAPDTNLIGAAVGGSVVFSLDADGDLYARNLVLTGSTSSGTTTVAGDITIEGNTLIGDATTDTISIFPTTLSFAKENAHTIQITDSTTANTAGGALTVKAAAGVGSGNGGALSLAGGAAGATGTGGAISVTSGAGGGTSGTSGALTLSTATAAAGANTGTISIDTGTATGGGTTGSISIGTGSAAKTITIGNATGATALALTSGTGSQTFTSNVLSGTTTTSGFVFDATAITSGTGLYLTSDSVTTGRLLDIATTGNTWTGNSTTSGLVNLASTSTAGTASDSDILLNIARSGANANTAHTAYGVYSTVTNTNVTSGTNIAGYFSATGATTANYGIQVGASTATGTNNYGINVGALTGAGTANYGVYINAPLNAGTNIGLYNAGTTVLANAGAAALSVGANGATNPAFLVDASTASSATGISIKSAAAAGGVALAAISSGTDENLKIDAKGAGTVSIGATSTGDILLAGGSGAFGCTVTNSNGDLTCTGNVTGSTSGTVGFWSRSTTTLSPATANDIVSIANTTTSGADLAVTNTGIYTGTGIVNITADSATAGTLLALSADALTTGKGIDLTSTSNAWDSGVLLNVSSSQTAATDTTLSADTANISFSPTYSTAVTTPAISGNVLDIARTITTNNLFASTLTVSGAVVSISDTSTQTTGTLTHSGDVLALTQNYGTTTGAILSLTPPATTNAGGTLEAINIGNITTSSGTDLALTFGTGWDTDINATTSLEIGIGGTNELTLTATALAPSTDSGQDLGTSSSQFADLFLDGGNINLDNLTDIDIDNDLASSFTISEGTNNFLNIKTTVTDAMEFGNATTNPTFGFLGTGAVTIAGSADGTDALVLTLGDILITNGDFDLSGGDFNVTLDSADTADLIGTAPASVAGNGTSAATNTLLVIGTAGGASSGVTGQTGGTGGALSLTSGVGGAVAGASGIGGVGGGLTLAGGAGGAGAATGGAGGAVSMTAGAAGTGGNANGGTLTLNSGAITGSGTSTINLGSANATTVNLATSTSALAVNLGPASTTAVTVAIAGGSADTGCSIAGDTGNLTCAGNITGSSSGTAGFWSRTSPTLSPATAGDNVSIGAISTAGTNNFGLSLSTLTGGTTSNYQISTGVLTSATTTTNAQLNLGGVVTTGGTTNYGINVGALSGSGTTNYGINVAASTATGTNNYGINVGALTGAGTNNYGIYINTPTSASGTNAALATAGGYSLFGTGTKNAGNLGGVTINQGAADDEILSFKSSDIAHGITGITETDTYAFFMKNSATDGGVQLLVPVENAVSATAGIRLYTLTTGDATKTKTSMGAIQLWVAGSAGTGGGSFTGDGNLLVIGNNAANHFIFSEEGELYMLGSTGVATETPGLRGIDYSISTGSANGLTQQAGLLTITGASTTYFQNSFLKNNVTAATALTIDNAATVYIDAAPATTGLATITNAYSLWVDAGNARFDGDLVTGSTSLNVFNDTATTLSLGGAATTALNLGNGTGNYTAINIGSSTGTHTINIAGTGATGADTINIGTGGTTADTITIGSTLASTSLALNDDNWNITGAGVANFVSVGATAAGSGAFTTLTSNNTTTIGNGSGIITGIGNAGGAAAINLTSGTGSQTFTSSVVSGITTASAFVFAPSAITTGTGIYASSSTLSSGSLVDLAITGTAGLTNQKGINVSLSGANATGAQTTYGGYFSNTHTGTSTNVGLYATATGGSNNYAAIFEAGNVGIGDTTPDSPLEVFSTSAQLRLSYADGTDTTFGVDTSGNLTIDGTGTKQIMADDLQINGGDILDTNGNESLRFTTTASAVNEFTMANAATANFPTLSATGGDTNIDLNITPKGTGGLNLTTGGFYQPVYGTDDNLVLYMPFSEGTGTKAYDRSPYGNDGTITGATWTTASKYGNALSFDGTGDDVSIPSSASNNITGSMSLGLWVKINGACGSGVCGMVMKGSYSYDSYIVSNQFNFRAVGATTGAIVSSSNSFNDGNWRFVVVTYDAPNATLKMYVNGVQDTAATVSGTVPTSMTANGDALIIGARGLGVTNGILDEISIYNRILSVDEVKTHYLRGRSENAAVAMSTLTTAESQYGFRSILTDTGIVTTGTDTTYGSRLDVTRTGATGGTINTYGQYINLVSDNAGSGTHTAYGLYSTLDGAADTNYGLYSVVSAAASQTSYALYADAGTGAGTEYAAAFMNGNVGIGTITPTTLLSAVGSISSAATDAIATITNNNTTDSANTIALRINLGTGVTTTNSRYATFYANVTSGDTGGSREGSIQSTNGGVAYNTGAGDFAERFYVPETTEPGDVIGIVNGVNAKATTNAKLLGVVSDTAGFVGNNKEDADPATNPIVGLLGQVKTKVSTENGPILIGDYLTSSSTPGVAMKATKPGLVVGKALAAFDCPATITSPENAPVCSGKVMTFINVSYADPGDFLANLSMDDQGNLLAPKIKTDKLVLNYDFNVTPPAQNSVLAYETTAALNGSVSFGIEVAKSLQNLEAKAIDLDLKQASASAELADLKTNVASSSAVLSAQIASQSAALAQAKDEINNLKLTPPDVLLATGSAILANLKVTSEATFSAKLAAYDLTASNTFKSFGETSLGNTTVAGSVSIDGTMSLTGNSLNVIGLTPDAGILYLQNSALAQAVDLFNGKVIIDSTGQIKAQSISVAEFKAVSNKVTGSGTILAGTKTAEITSSLVKITSRILVTPTILTNQILIVTDKIDGQKFIVSVAQNAPADINFDWFVINEVDQ